MADRRPKIYLLQGDDEFAMSEVIRDLKSRLGDETTAEMNTLSFSASELDWPAFESAASSLPFLSDRRIVILDHAERVLKDTDKAARLLALCETIPESTALLLLDHSSGASSGKAQASSTLRQWAAGHPDISHIIPCETPKGYKFQTWLQQRAEVAGGAIESDAAALLAEWTQEDPRLASQELEKLLDYVGFQHPIRVTDVEQCTPYRGQSNIFDLVDAIGLRQGEKALAKLHQVLKENDVNKVFAMIVRQFRLILRARDLIDAGKSPDRSIHRSDFVVKKVAGQARNFSLADLERIYHELLEIDLGSKTGQMELDVALDRLVSIITT